MVLEGKIALAPFVEQHPLEETPEILEAVADHKLRRRAILIPNHRAAKHGAEETR
jgi:6-hydroxycyclohex-1-ene-1-carbonyl-CoA dehydrogenase